MIEQISQTAEYIKSKVSDIPQIAIILGTGLGALVDHITDKQYIPYAEIPNFPILSLLLKLRHGKFGIYAILHRFFPIREGFIGRLAAKRRH